MTEITWFKLWHEALDDVKFLGIADRIQSEPARVFHVFLKLLKRASENEDRGSITGFDDWGEAAWLRIPVEEVHRIVEAIRDIGMIVGDRIAKWAKRQGAAAKKLATKVVSAAAQRQRRYRQKKARDPRQQEMLFTIPGDASPSVTEGVTVTAEKEGRAQSESPSFIESLRAELGFLENNKGGFCGRDAPFVEPPPPAPVVKLADGPALKEKKKEARRQKVMRFVNAKYTGIEHERRIKGMLGLDEIRDEQWWFDKCDAERQVAGWDDVRDRERRMPQWRRLA